ncbi:BMC domain-containing protein [Thermohalobacter berrensis]|uniref:BMC domain-containing protein n=1 Tax=Thermohalobacter berrensis TaxID=99594 RepID=A0A419T5P0_9FIRM|nr:hypothetical protein BET03_10505 [Thermohalobacter berrensis]
MKLALGIIETVGLAAAIEAADTSVKSANVKLLGYELSRGGGLVTVKIEGDIGAVNAAVKAGVKAAERVNKVWSKKVIPRPHKELSILIQTKETIGLTKKNKKCTNLTIKNKEEITKKQVEVGANKEELENEQNKLNDANKSNEICNLCGDPKCPRKKGELKIKCIHFKKEGGVNNG